MLLKSWNITTSFCFPLISPPTQKQRQEKKQSFSILRETEINLTFMQVVKTK